MTINGLSERRDDFVVITLLKGNLITSGERLKVPPLRIAWVRCQILASSLLLALFFRLHFEKSLSICFALGDKVLLLLNNRLRGCRRCWVDQQTCARCCRILLAIYARIQTLLCPDEEALFDHSSASQNGQLTDIVRLRTRETDDDVVPNAIQTTEVLSPCQGNWSVY